MLMDKEERIPSVFIRAIRGQNLFFSQLQLCSEVKSAVNHS
jgi:hypothetical protein